MRIVQSFISFPQSLEIRSVRRLVKMWNHIINKYNATKAEYLSRSNSIRLSIIKQWLYFSHFIPCFFRSSWEMGVCPEYRHIYSNLNRRPCVRSQLASELVFLCTGICVLGHFHIVLLYDLLFYRHANHGCFGNTIVRCGHSVGALLFTRYGWVETKRISKSCIFCRW